MATLTRNGTEGRVYGGDCNLVHIKDGERSKVGELTAHALDAMMRTLAARQGNETENKALCPGCYMIALFNAALILARKNGQPVSELAHTMAAAFTKLASNVGEGLTEEIEVILDND